MLPAALRRALGRQLSRAGRRAAPPAARAFASEAAPAAEKKSSSNVAVWLFGLAGLGAGGYYAKEQGYLDSFLNAPPKSAAPVKKDYGAVRKAIADALEVEDYDDGSYGPIFVRLAWHSSGSYDKATNTGGSNGATMRFEPEANFGANAGLRVARDALEPIKKANPWISYADLWTLAGAVAVEELGGPTVAWRPGRTDKEDGSHCPPDGRLPDGAQGAKHLRDVFYRMGFDDREIVVLSGAHALGRCHRDRSGFQGPWTNAPTTFSNLYYQELLNNKWTLKKWDGPHQYKDPTDTLMMLPTDMALLWDKKFKKFVQEYAADDAKFAEDFGKAFSKLLSLGVPEEPQEVATA